MKGLLIETNLFEGKIQEDASGRTLVKGVLQRAGAENQNGRVYPKNILDREVKKYQQLIQERRALGELDHPESTVINLKNVSHNIKEVHWEGDDVVGTGHAIREEADIVEQLTQCQSADGIINRD